MSTTNQSKSIIFLVIGAVLIGGSFFSGSADNQGASQAYILGAFFANCTFGAIGTGLIVFGLRLLNDKKTEILRTLAFPWILAGSVLALPAIEFSMFLLGAGQDEPGFFTGDSLLNSIKILTLILIISSTTLLVIGFEKYHKIKKNSSNK